MEGEELQKAYGKIVVKAWGDEEFKEKLLADPAAVFKDNGIDIPQGVEVKMVEAATEKVVHFVLPPPPTEAELSEEDLDKVAGGMSYQNQGMQIMMKGLIRFQSKIPKYGSTRCHSHPPPVEPARDWLDEWQSRKQQEQDNVNYWRSKFGY